MAEYYYSNQLGGRGGRNAKKRRSVWMAMLDILMSILSIATVFTLVIIFVGRLFEPEKLWYFSLAGLVAPIVYLVATAISLYWIIRWRWRIFCFTAAFVIIGIPYISLYYKAHIGKEYGTPRYEKGNTKILSYNVHYLQNEKWTKPTTDSIVSIIKHENPDIVCFQEFPIRGAEYDKALSMLSKYNRTQLKTPYEDGAVCFTKYKIIRSDSISGFRGTGNGIWADLRINNDTVRLFNIHLQTTSINVEERNYINNREFLETTDESRLHKVVDMARRLYENSCTRSYQVDLIREQIDLSPYPVIVCGDFNDVPMSYAYRTLAGRLNDSFSEMGNGHSYTFSGFFNLLRIDYILSSKHFNTLSYDVLQTDLSDHYPVMSRVILKKQ